MDQDHYTPPGADNPNWQKEAEDLGKEVREEIRTEIADDFSGSLPFYIHNKFGMQALRETTSMGEANFPRYGEGMTADEFIELTLERYAVNREAFRRLAEKDGFRDVTGVSRAMGNELLAVMTRSGSMLFAGAGSLTEEGPIRYLPISGRNMSPTEGNGLLIPTRLVQDPDNGLIGIKEQGYLPQKGNVLLVEGVKGLGRTSDLVEVKMRYSVGDPGRDMGAQAMMASMTSLNEDWR